MKTKTNDQFIFDANKIHCNRYSYSKTNYKTNKDKCVLYVIGTVNSDKLRQTI